MRYELSVKILAARELISIKTQWDDVSPIEETDKLVQKFCKNGASILVSHVHYSSVCTHCDCSTRGTAGSKSRMPKSVSLVRAWATVSARVFSQLAIN
jgi:hypothetical protein